MTYVCDAFLLTLIKTHFPENDGIEIENTMSREIKSFSDELSHQFACNFKRNTNHKLCFCINQTYQITIVVLFLWDDKAHPTT